MEGSSLLTSSSSRRATALPGAHRAPAHPPAACRGWLRSEWFWAATGALLTVIIVAAVITSAGGGGGNNMGPPLVATPLWQNFMHNPAHTSHSTNAAPRGPVIGERWSQPHVGKVKGQAVIPVDGKSLYVGGNGAVYKLSAATGDVVWAVTTGGVVAGTPALTDDGATLVAGCEDTKVYAIDTQRGDKIWTFSTGGAVDSSPVFSQQHVYVGSADGYVYSLTAAGGDLVWKAHIGGVSSSPAVLGNVVFVGSDTGVYALNRLTGAQVWAHATGAAVTSSVSLALNAGGDGVTYVYVGCNDDKLYGLAATDGSVVANVSTNGQVTASPIGDNNGFIYVASEDNNLYALDVAAEEWLWVKPLATGTTAVTDVHGTIVLASSSTAFVWALDPATGNTVWQYQGTAPFGDPVVADGVVYVGDTDGTFYCLTG